jgi:putative transposase
MEQPPKCIRSDNGPKFVATAVQDWVKSRQIDCIYVAPGSPWENGYFESFHSRFRNDCLNREWFINELDERQLSVTGASTTMNEALKWHRLPITGRSILWQALIA